jgi:hypothetical protein
LCRRVALVDSAPADQLYVQAVDSDNREHVLSLSAAPLGGTPPKGAAVISGALPVYPESVNLNRKGAVAFLEESEVPSGSNVLERRPLATTPAQFDIRDLFRALVLVSANDQRVG